jgi:hypothetical protein
MPISILGSKILVSGYNIADYIRNITVKAGVDLKDSTVVSSTKKEYSPALQEATVELDGFYYGGVNEIDAIVESITDRDYLTLIYDNSNFSSAKVFRILKKEKRIEAAADDLVAIKISFETELSKNGILIFPYQTKSGSGTGYGSVYDQGSSQTKTYGIVVHVTSVTGTLSVYLQDSPDQSTWTSRISITGINSVISSFNSTSRTWGRYLRISYNLTGTSPSATFCVSLIEI